MPGRREAGSSPQAAAARLVLVRHGESLWNQQQRFTGWADVGLTQRGVAQMRAAGRAISRAGIEIQGAFASVLSRCIRSQWILLDALDCIWVPQCFDWRLNERHYGGLTGRTHAEAVAEFGEAAVHRWRRSYDAQPPALDAAASRFVTIDRRYAALSQTRIPLGESLREAVVRVGSAWKDGIAPALRGGRTVLVTGHGNALRGLIGIIERLPDAAVSHIEVANGAPIVYELDAELVAAGRTDLAVPAGPRSIIL